MPGSMSKLIGPSLPLAWTASASASPSESSSRVWLDWVSDLVISTMRESGRERRSWNLVRQGYLKEMHMTIAQMMMMMIRARYVIWLWESEM